MLSRRSALRSLFFAAPAIVAAPTLMRISAKFLMPPRPMTIMELLEQRIRQAEEDMRESITHALYSDYSPKDFGLAALVRGYA